MPVVAGMGGNAATQTLTVIVRGIALGELDLGEHPEGPAQGSDCRGRQRGRLRTGRGHRRLDLEGQSIWLGAVIGAAMVINMFVAATAGTLIPLGLRALKVDPALASSVFITTLTDVFGFLSFLGLATLVLKHFSIGG